MSDLSVRVLAFGDSAVLLQVEGDDDSLVEGRVLAIVSVTTALHERDPRYGRPVPGFASVLVPVDTAMPGVERAVERLEALVDEESSADGEAIDDTLIGLPVRYGGPDGPDLAAVAELHGLTPAQVIEAHASTEYRVRFLGFAPGFAYLWRLPAAIATPRLETPRERVPAGSVGIAGEMTAVYPGPSPGGWRLIGRATTRVWNPASSSPASLVPGRRVRFLPER